jgi:hypothetical protein
LQFPDGLEERAEGASLEHATDEWTMIPNISELVGSSGVARDWRHNGLKTFLAPDECNDGRGCFRGQCASVFAHVITTCATAVQALCPRVTEQVPHGMTHGVEGESRDVGCIFRTAAGSLWRADPVDGLRSGRVAARTSPEEQALLGTHDGSGLIL